jgi:hypothetical protein
VIASIVKLLMMMRRNPIVVIIEISGVSVDGSGTKQNDDEKNSCEHQRDNDFEFVDHFRFSFAMEQMGWLAPIGLIRR